MKKDILKKLPAALPFILTAGFSFAGTVFAADVILEDSIPRFERLFAFSAVAEEEFIKKAAGIGITDVTGTPSEKLIFLCSKYNINFYPLITISPAEWKKRFPGEKVPVQKMTDAQEAMKEFLKGNVKLQVSYQWGGEPEKKHESRKFNEEVLTSDLLCFHNPGVIEMLKSKIREHMELPGIAGIAFDGIGYQNYHDCLCPDSVNLYKEYCARNKAEQNEKTWQDFSLQTLVDFNNALVDYVHSLNPQAKTFNHIWPVYLPEPLYGNRLKMDYCGQTAAWYFYWDPLKIEQYSRVITGEEKKYWQNARGVTFIGYYDSLKHPDFPCKSPEKVESELRAMLKGGSRMLMVCGLKDVLGNPDIAAVFKKFMNHSVPGSE